MSKKTTKEISKTDREETHKVAQDSTTETVEIRPNLHNFGGLIVKISPVQQQQLGILADIDSTTPEDYAAKLIGRHISDRLYLLRSR